MCPSSVMSASTAPGPVPALDSAYWTFYAEVAAAQLAQWLPTEHARVLDLSQSDRFTAQLVALGHEVIQVGDRTPMRPPPAMVGPGRVLTVVGDTSVLSWLRDESVDLVLAESQALSRCLATEVTIEHLGRVLRPGGRMLFVVESLGLGLARLADQGRWAELADIGSADVVLVPDKDGSISRCFWPTELHLLLRQVGLDVEWIRPRTVLTPATVELAMATGGAETLTTLVHSELALAVEREGETTGLHLVASARRT